MATSDASLQRAMHLQQQGLFSDAIAQYDQFLLEHPDNPTAYLLLGVAQAQAGNTARAVDCLQRAIQLAPTASAYVNLGLVYLQLSKPLLAIEKFHHALALEPEHVKAHLGLARSLMAGDQYYAALASLHEALRHQPAMPNLWSAISRCHVQLHQFDAAHRVLDIARAKWPSDPEWTSLARVIGDAEIAHQNQLNQALTPDQRHDPEAIFNKAQDFYDAGEFAKAVEFFDASIALNTRSAASYLSRGRALARLHRHMAAVESFDRATALDPDSSDAHFGSGCSLFELREFDQAIAQFTEVIRLSPNHSDALFLMGCAHMEMDRYPAAKQLFSRLQSLPGHRNYLFGELAACHLYTCDWNGFSEVRQALLQHVRDKRLAAFPLRLLLLSDSAQLQQELAQRYTRQIFSPAKHVERPLPGWRTTDRLRIGYFSMDFRNHPVSYLIAELLEKHDRSRVEVFAFSYGPDVDDAMNLRIRHAVDHYLDVRAQSDSQVADMARDIGLDVAIDLAGYTSNTRHGIFMHRVAPVQVNYLGYPGSLGSACIDYIVGDRTVIPFETRRYYTEKIIDLPCYQVTDTTRQVDEHRFARADFGLPEHSMVYACFNACQKILPEMFTSWMKILRAVPDSVLFLFAHQQSVKDNLSNEASLQGISPSRLFFSGVLDPTANLSRYVCADLFLDTFPFNAGTTASDALWAGLPIISLRGESFAARMATSLLEAVGLQQLSVSSMDDYVRLAIELGTDKDRLSSIKQQLRRNRSSSSLFNTRRQASHLENGFFQAVHLARAGLPPEHIDTTSPMIADRAT